jgi:xanthine/CO dehydrogenase XdhC/CoxF family maturation factor
MTSHKLRIARLVARGLSNKEIARELKIAEGTVKVHLHHIFRRLKVPNRTALAGLTNGETKMINGEKTINIRVRAYKDGFRTAMVATAELQSFILAQATAKFWHDQGFAVTWQEQAPEKELRL